MPENGVTKILIGHSRQSRQPFECQHEGLTWILNIVKDLMFHNPTLGFDKIQYFGWFLRKFQSVQSKFRTVLL
jgi:hypothetical protein